MLELMAPNTTEIVVKKSRFLAEAIPVGTQQEAREVLRTQKKRFADAAHVVHAFAVGPEGLIYGCSDDGEPPGTAGRPVLEVLKGSGITRVLVTVTRWFGGTLLGTGGLVKAYGDAAKAVLSGAETRQLTLFCNFQVDLPYTLHEKILRELKAAGVQEISESFDVAVSLQGSVEDREWERIKQLIIELSAGQCTARLL